MQKIAILLSLVAMLTGCATPAGQKGKYLKGYEPNTSKLGFQTDTETELSCIILAKYFNKQVSGAGTFFACEPTNERLKLPYIAMGKIDGMVFAMRYPDLARCEIEFKLNPKLENVSGCLITPS